MSLLGVTPTIQTSKEFEGIASLEEVTDGTFGAPTVKLGAYTLQNPEPETPAFRWGAYLLMDPVREPPRAPTPEMAPILDAMVINVPSEEEDTVSLREEDLIPEGSGLFGDDEDDAPLPQGLKLNLDDDMSDYGDDPETLCSPIIEPAPTPVAGPSRTSRRAWETTGPQPYKHWSDDHDAYEGPTDNELVPFCSHKGTSLTDLSTASISIDIGRSLDKYLAYAKINCGYASLCADCKDNSKSNFIEWIVDSGASVHFTDNKADFSDLRFFDEKDRPKAQTANGAAAIHGHGTVFVKTWVDNTNSQTATISRLSPVFYMPGIGIHLLSMGLLLKGNMQIKGNEHTLEFFQTQTGKVKIVALTKLFTDTIYWVKSEVLTGSELTTHKSMHRDNYDLWHRRLGHPGKQVFEKFESSMRNFPRSIEVPKNPPVCEGCAKGKMHSRSFPENSAHATRPFQRIHSDLKEFAVQSYHKYKYYISFLDDNSSHSWISLLKKKSDSKTASKQFIAMVKMQYNMTIGEWMTDNGGEYVDKDYVKLLKDEQIKIQRSVPSQLQMNGRAEHFNHTIDEKAESMHHQACLPDNWWEFSVLHVNYLYNCTPVWRLDWQTPKGYLDEFKPNLSHLCILGCGAYVFIHKDL